MTLKYYNAYMGGIAKSPVDDWRELMQESINDTWENTSTVTIVQGQNIVGQKTYNDESVQLNSVTDAKTGKTLSDEYRKIIYKNVAQNYLPPNEKNEENASQRWLGKYYKFDNSTWLTYNTSTVIGALDSAILRRCNNKLKWVDGDGILHSWDCVFSRDLSSTNFKEGSQEVPQVNADIIICVQRNSETDTIPYNQRFIFDGYAFQVKQINKHISKTYMELYMFETQIRVEDDLVNNVANGGTPIVETTNGIIISPDGVKILENETQVFEVYNYIDGTRTNDAFSVVVGSDDLLDKNYCFSFDGKNKFAITNILESDVPLVITCKDNVTNETKNVEITLGGEW